jgi:hypothetical protein
MENEMDASEKERELQLALIAARPYIAAKARLTNEIAEWMAAQVRDRGKLDHHEAANAVRRRAPHDVMLWNPIIEAQERNDRDGSIREVYRFSPSVLEKFRALTGNTVRWGKKDRYWVFKPKARCA